MRTQLTRLLTVSLLAPLLAGAGACASTPTAPGGGPGSGRGPSPTPLPASATCAPDDDACRADALGDMAMGWLRLGLTTAEVTGKLGAPTTQTPPEEWGADGLFHATLEWPDRGIFVSVVSEKPDLPGSVESYTVHAPFAERTERGIALGATEAEVTAAYADLADPRATVAGEELVAGSVYGGMFFRFEAGRLTSIFAGAGAE